MNYHQTLEEIIKNATAEQRILWNSVFLKFGEKIGLSQFYFHDVILGSEFLIYSPNKLYLALSVNFYNGNNLTPASPYVVFYNEINTMKSSSQNVVLVWDSTAVAIKHSLNNIIETNLYFSRIVAVGYTQIKFIGYRLSI